MNIRTALLTLIALGTIAGAKAFASDSVADAAVEALFERYWDFEERENPLSATSNGRHEFNDQLPDVSPAAIARRHEAAESFLAELRAVDRQALSTSNQVNADLLAFILGHDVALDAFNNWRRPFLADSGFHSSILYTVRATPFATPADYENYLKRLAALPGYFDQNVANMRQGVAEGFVQPKAIMPGVLSSFEAMATPSATAHPLFAPFNSMPASFSSREARRLRAAGEKTMTEKVLPAYRALFEFMRDEYAPAASDTVGVAALPGGEDYYRALVRYYTTLDDATPEAIHELGKKEVARIRAEMAEVIKQTDFKGSFEEFQQFLRTDPQFYAKTENELLMEASWMAKRVDGRLPALFNTLPRQPYSVEPVPAAIAANYTTGRYISAAKDAPRGGEYWVNTSQLDKRPLYELMALTLHEAVPGHHLQSALSLEIEGAPEFRTQFYPHAFGEGWGLYSEKLGVEMDVYRTPYEHFGRLSYEMWRACRLVIDTGVHLYGWTREQAIDYLASNTALSLHNVQTEVDRYISWPGQALAYKMGELTLWELRRKAEKELGDKFDVREFHDVILLDGGLPLEMLRAKVDAYIAEAKSKG